MCSPFTCFGKSRSNNNNNNDNNLENGTKSIEKHMKLAKKMEEKTIRLLLLGPGSSGKTTILKQIKKIHCKNKEIELNDRQKITSTLKTAIIEYIQILCEQSVILNKKYNCNTLIQPEYEYLRKEILELSLSSPLTEDMALKIQMLWSDNGIKQTLKERRYYQIHDNVDYFFNKIETISAPDYTPDFNDYLRFRQRTTGFSQTNVIMNVGNFGEHAFEFTDVGGQRSERKKWMRFISEDINAVLYILAISDYDLTLFEDNKTNRLHESINLFRNIMIKGKFFAGKSILIFFNKYDIFKQKIKHTPITVAFDDFPENEMNANDDNDVVRFIAGKFLNVFQEENIELKSPLHIIRTTALDTNNIEKIIADITMDLVQTNLQNYGIM